jgi:hypothetical protein
MSHPPGGARSTMGGRSVSRCESFLGLRRLRCYDGASGRPARGTEI